jgi:4-hydroxymandelate oxidase
MQVYVQKDRASTEAMVQRAAACGYTALVLTVDLPVLGRRERDARSGFELPFLPHLDSREQIRDQRYGPIEDQRIAGLTWSSLEEIRSWSAMPFVVKGILAPDDARRAVDAGVDGIVVSNHGGRQLDRAIATAEVLAPVVDAVGGRCEVWVDGGIRRGLDVLVALALGATGVMIGRPFYWALAAGGRAGVERAATLLRNELEIALALLGCASMAEVDRSLLA